MGKATESQPDSTWLTGNNRAAGTESRAATLMSLTGNRLGARSSPLQPLGSQECISHGVSRGNWASSGENGSPDTDKQGVLCAQREAALFQALAPAASWQE